METKQVDDLISMHNANLEMLIGIVLSFNRLIIFL